MSNKETNPNRVERGLPNSGEYTFGNKRGKTTTPPKSDLGWQDVNPMHQRAASRNPAMTEEDAIQLGHNASLEVANAIGATENWPQMWRGREDKAAASYEFGNGCRITVFVVYREDRYEILGSRYSKSGANLNGDSATIYGLHNVAEMQAAMHTMALELPRRRKG